MGSIAWQQPRPPLFLSSSVSQWHPGLLARADTVKLIPGTHFWPPSLAPSHTTRHHQITLGPTCKPSCLLVLAALCGPDTWLLTGAGCSLWLPAMPPHTLLIHCLAPALTTTSSIFFSLTVALWLIS